MNDVVGVDLTLDLLLPDVVNFGHHRLLYHGCWWIVSHRGGRDDGRLWHTWGLPGDHLGIGGVVQVHDASQVFGGVLHGAGVGIGGMRAIGQVGGTGVTGPAGRQRMMMRVFGWTKVGPGAFGGVLVGQTGRVQARPRRMYSRRRSAPDLLPGDDGPIVPRLVRRSPDGGRSGVQGWERRSMGLAGTGSTVHVREIGELGRGQILRLNGRRGRRGLLFP